MIYGETEHTDGTPILNIRWPQRGLFHIQGVSGGQTLDVYVWDDNFGDALESAAEWGGEEGDDDDLNGVEITGEARTEIVDLTNAANAKEPT